MERYEGCGSEEWGMNMISVWHLLWIVPFSVTVGIFLGALMGANGK